MDTGKGIGTNVKGDSQTFGCMVQKTWNTWKWRCKNQHVYCDFLSFQHMPPITSTNCVTFPSMPSSCAFLLLISQLWPGRAHAKKRPASSTTWIYVTGSSLNNTAWNSRPFLGESGELQKFNYDKKIHTHNLFQDQHLQFKKIPKLANFQVGGWGGRLSGED